MDYLVGLVVISESKPPKKRNYFYIMKTVKVTLVIAAAAFLGVGCASTLTVGPQANDDSYLGASASTKGASVTVPFVKAGVKATETKKK